MQKAQSIPARQFFGGSVELAAQDHAVFPKQRNRLFGQIELAVRVFDPHRIYSREQIKDVWFDLFDLLGKS